MQPPGGWGPPGYPPAGYPPPQQQGYGYLPLQTPPKKTNPGLIVGAIGALLLLAAVGVVAAVVLLKPTPESTFGAMKSSACQGDVQGFFSHVDKTKVGEGITKSALAAADASTKGPAVGKAIGASIAASAMPAVVQRGFTEWEDDIKKGEAGDLCKMSFASAQQASETSAIVRWKTGTGRDKSYTFERFGDKWMVVDMK